MFNFLWLYSNLFVGPFLFFIAMTSLAKELIKHVLSLGKRPIGWEEIPFITNIVSINAVLQYVIRFLRLNIVVLGYDILGY